MSRATARLERRGALGLLMAGCAAAAWIHWCAAQVIVADGRRQAQLEQLATWMASGRPAGPRCVAAEPALDGLFPRHRVGWRTSAAGPTLSLAAEPEELPR